MGIHTYVHHLAIFFFFFFTEDMWSQCVSAPSEEVCIGLPSRRIKPPSPSFLPPPPPFFPCHLLHSFIFSACLETCSPAKMQHLRIARRRFVFLAERNLSDVHCYDERRNFPVEMDNIFRENIGNFILERRRDKFPLFLFRGKKRISFPSKKRARTDSQSLSTRANHCFFFGQHVLLN